MKGLSIKTNRQEAKTFFLKKQQQDFSLVWRDTWLRVIKLNSFDFPEKSASNRHLEIQSMLKK